MSARWLAPLFALTALVGLADRLPAENGDLKFEFSTDPNGPKENVSNLDVRPNTGQPYYLFLRNKSGSERTVTVQIIAADGKTLLAVATLTDVPRDLAGDKATLVKLVPPPKEPPPAGAPPAAPPAPATAAGGPMATPMTPPPPPGEELKLTQNPKIKERQDYFFYIRAFDDRAKDKPAEKQKEPSEEVTVLVTIRQPTDYVERDVEKKIIYTKSGNKNELKVSMKSSANFFAGTNPCPVDLVFPVQRNINAKAMREGVFRRMVTMANESVRLYAKDMPVRGPAEGQGIFYINIDGVPRAYVYSYTFMVNTDDPKGVAVTTFAPNAIRVFEHDKNDVYCVDDVQQPVLATRPRVVPLRVEPDTTKTDAGIEVSILPLSGEEAVAKITRAAPRERRVWLEAPNAKGGLLLTSQVGDWVLPLDLSNFRGRYKLRATLRDNSESPPSVDRDLIVDDTRPEKVTLEVRPGPDSKKVPPEHLRTKPLRVRVNAADPESDIARVVVFFGKVAPDGKLPEVVAEAVRLKKDGLLTDVWEADVPLPAPPPPAPPPPPGTPILPPAPKIADVTCIAVNGVGLMSEPVSLRIQLIDPPTGGIIKGTVQMSKFGKPLPGVKVIMLDMADGKEKGQARTDDKTGEFIFKNVVPGSYRLLAAKPDAGVGTKGFDDVSVLAGEEKSATIILTRRP